MNKKFKSNFIFCLFILMVLLGKIVRYTVMKESLVDTGIGNFLIKYIVNNNVSYGITLQNNNVSAEETANATDNSTFLFSLINIFNIKTYRGFEIYISIIWNLILLILLTKIKDSLSLFQTVFILLSISVLNIFDFCLAKEPIQMLYFLLMYIILSSYKIKNKTKFLLCSFVFILSALTFRVYYFLMFIFFIFIEIFYKIYIKKLNKVKLKQILIILIFIALSYLIILYSTKILSSQIYNELIRVRLRTSTAVSDIRSLFRSRNIILLSVDYIVILIRMLFPVELLRLGVKYIIYFIYQILISTLVIKNIIKIKNIESTKRICLFIFIAFLMGSAAFEPDFGSWIRHEAVTFPILLILSDSIKEKRKDKLNEENII